MMNLYEIEVAGDKYYSVAPSPSAALAVFIDAAIDWLDMNASSMTINCVEEDVPVLFHEEEED